MISCHNVGTLYVGGDSPFSFASIQDALDYVQGLRRVGVGQPITVFLTHSEYQLAAPLRIGAGISDVTIRPVGQNRVSVLGGVRIEGFAQDNYNGMACFSAPLPAQCMDANGQCNFTDLYVNGSRAALTRYPASGCLYPETVEVPYGPPQHGSRWFIARPGDMPDFKNIERIQLSFCHYWIDEHTPIESFDPETRRVTFKYRSRMLIGGGPDTASGLQYYLENVAEAFANPGEWYADNGRIYYIPTEGVTLENIAAYAPVLEQLVEVCGAAQQPVRGIRFCNIDFGVTKGEYASHSGDCSRPEETVEEYFASDPQAVASADGAVSFRYAQNCSLEKCAVKNFGLHGIVLHCGCANVRIQHCWLRDGGAGGIVIDGGRVGLPQWEYTHDNTVTDCTILHCGKRYFAACGILMMHTYNNTVAHNEIGHLYYTGVSVGWVWGYADSMTHHNLITKNHIHHLGGGVLSDMGGVYLLGRQPGTVVSGNVIHDIYSRHYGGWALYTDEGSSFITLENNICYNTSDNCHHQHYGSMNVVRNNIFAFADQQMVRLTRVEPHLSAVYECNILYAKGVPMFDVQKAHIGQGTFAGDRNIYFDCTRKAPVMAKLADGKELDSQDFAACGIDSGSVVADPLFRDVEHFDFSLLPASPAFEMGFCPIDASDVGVRR